MALQNSGTITMDDIGKEFRGPQPYDLQSHYRGGGKVPAQIPGFMNPPTGGNPTRGGTVVPSAIRCDATGNWNAPETCLEESTSNACGQYPEGHPDAIAVRDFACPSGNRVNLYAPCNVSGPGSRCGEKWVSVTSWWTNYVPGLPPSPAGINSYQYLDGSSPGPNPPGPNPPGPNPPNPVVPGNMNPAIPINTGVPRSGRIAVEDFYGARR